MPVTTVSIRDLSRRAGAIVRRVRATGEPVIVTYRRRPMAILTAVDAEAVEDWVLGNAPGFRASLREADEDLATGRTVTIQRRYR